MNINTNNKNNTKKKEIQGLYSKLKEILVDFFSFFFL